MMGKKQRLTGPAVFIAIVVGGVFLLAVGLGIFWHFYQKASIPSISILEPGEQIVLTSGQGIMLVVEGKAANGVGQISFFVNDILQSQHPAPQGKERTFLAAIPWFGSKTGIHKLSVIAYNKNGQPSQPASLLVAVEADLLSQPISRVVGNQNAEGYVGDTGSQSDGESVDGPNQPGDGESAGNDVGEGQDGRNEDLFNQADIENDNFPLDFPNHPPDDPPTIEIQSASVRQGDKFNISGSATARDDSGLDFIDFVLFADGMPLETRTEDCLWARDCAVDFDFSFFSGERTVVVRAFDTSGQASEPIEKSYQIIEGEGGNPPSFVDLNQLGNFLAVVLNQQGWGEQALDNLGWVGGVFNLHDIVVIPQSPQPGDINGDGPFIVGNLPDGCLVLSVTLGEEGCLSTGVCQAVANLDVYCDITAPEASMPERVNNMYFSYEWDYEGLPNHLPNSMGGIYFTGSGIPPGWNRRGTTSLAIGDHLEQRVVGQCGASVRYSATVEIHETDDSQEIDSVVFEYPQCPPGSFASHVHLEASASNEGTNVHWNIDDDLGDSIDNLPVDFHFHLFRYFPDLNQYEIFFDDRVVEDQLPGFSLAFLDNSIVCGKQFIYTLVARQPPAVIFTKVVPGPVGNCSNGLDQLSLQVTPDWVEGEFVIHVEVVIPANFSWPEGENVTLRVLRTPTNLPVVPVLEIFPSQVLAAGDLIGFDDEQVACGHHYSYTYYLVLYADGEIVEQGNYQNVPSPDCE